MIFLLLICFVLSFSVQAQTISKEQLVFYTAEWEGERFPDGRPIRGP